MKIRHRFACGISSQLAGSTAAKNSAKRKVGNSTGRVLCGRSRPSAGSVLRPARMVRGGAGREGDDRLWTLSRGVLVCAPVMAPPARLSVLPTDAVQRRSRTAAYVALTKPRIIELLLVTTVPTMIVAEHGMPSPWLMLATVAGGAAAAGGANAINMVVDRDIDRLMERTKGRPLVTG